MIDTKKPDAQASECCELLTGGQWKKSRREFEVLAKRHGWDTSEHPLHALYLDVETQRFWEVFKAGAISAS